MKGTVYTKRITQAHMQNVNKKGLQTLRACNTHCSGQKRPSQHMSEQRCQLRYGWCSSYLYNRRCVLWLCLSTQVQALRITEVRAL